MALRGFTTFAMAMLTATSNASPLSPTPSSNLDLPLTKSYRLYLNLTNPLLDFPENPLQGQYLTAVRAGPSSNAPTITNTSSSATRFSTTNRQTTQVSQTLAINYTQAAYSIFMAGNDTDSPSAKVPAIVDLGIDMGNGTEGVYPSQNSCTSLATPKAGTFAVCDQVFDVYTHPRWLVVFVEGGSKDSMVPDEQGRACVPVSLVPECDSYDPGAGEGQLVEARCWEDAGAVTNWGDYGC